MADQAVLDLQAARERVILALDFPSAKPCLQFLDKLENSSACPPRWVKVGLELFLAEGPSLVRSLRARQYSVFLDLKLHDIPNTVASAIAALAEIDVQLLTVHAAGGPSMLAAAKKAAGDLRLLAVTVLTSVDRTELKAIGVETEPEDQVLRLARMANQAGIAGLVASPLEAAALRRDLGNSIWLVTPGIRSLHTSLPDDQRRVATPSDAIRAGASQLVVGRPVTRAENPSAAYDALLEEIASAAELQ